MSMLICCWWWQQWLHRKKNLSFLFRYSTLLPHSSVHIFLWKPWTATSCECVSKRCDIELTQDLPTCLLVFCCPAMHFWKCDCATWPYLCDAFTNFSIPRDLQHLVGCFFCLTAFHSGRMDILLFFACNCTCWCFQGLLVGNCCNSKMVAN